MNKEEQLILWFDQISIEDIKYVGGKNASLGEMYTNLTKKGVNIPNGFALTAKAYFDFIEQTGIKDRINQIVQSIDVTNMEDLSKKGHQIRSIIRTTPLPEHIANEVKNAYYHLCLQYGENTDVAVRSSATAEDLPDASFAGQQETYLNIKGDEAIIDAVRNCIASLFTNRAISYRSNMGFDQTSIALSVGVQKMVRSDVGTSGVLFTIDTETGFDDVVFITAIYGLGENIVQGKVNPDEYYVFEPTLKQGYPAIISKKLGSKDLRMVYSIDGKSTTKDVSVPIEERTKFALSDSEVLTLAKWGVIVEEHYSAKKGKKSPMDIEWAKDGITNQLYIVQARPETVQSNKNKNVIEKYILKSKSSVICKGKSVGNKIGQGLAKIIKTPAQIDQFKQGEILVTEMTDPDWNPIMKLASAVVTNKGGRTCHAAIVSRELGIPCVVGTENGTSKIPNGANVTVDCSSGDDGYVYDGKLPFEIEKSDISNVPETKTKIMINLGNPDLAFTFHNLPMDGVGLVREEFIVNSLIQVHPLALLHYDKVEDESTRAKIDEITHGYKNRADYFKDVLSYGIGMIAAAFYPKPVIVRLSDFKSNEYSNLIGGKYFEPNEENPMIGWRGASRYYHDNYKDAFTLECQALLKVRNEMGLKNMMIMVPFCRTLEEGRLIISELRNNGLVQGDEGLKIYAMCEVPSNVILADEFLDIFDGFSIGSNDLTQLALGLDRDSAMLSNLYDERNPAVLKLVKRVIEVAKEKGKYIGICGQAPSDHEDFAEFLVEAGIDSISLNPDVALKTKILIAKKEKELSEKKKSF
ncbi:MAG TPA: phosphoenolpyruvate synthase [Candidatus Woesearchaeota archaeon]|nr:phosphoenolpyruvate synthase [Candidatus Woesearchaeota archaeon]